MKLYVTIQEAAEMLGVSDATIRRKLCELGAVDLNSGGGGQRLIRIPVKSLESWARSCTIPRVTENGKKVGRPRKQDPAVGNGLRLVSPRRPERKGA